MRKFDQKLYNDVMQPFEKPSYTQGQTDRFSGGVGSVDGFVGYVSPNNSKQTDRYIGDSLGCSPATSSSTPPKPTLTQSTIPVFVLSKETRRDGGKIDYILTLPDKKRFGYNSKKNAVDSFKSYKKEPRYKDAILNDKTGEPGGVGWWDKFIGQTDYSRIWDDADLVETLTSWDEVQRQKEKMYYGTGYISPNNSRQPDHYVGQVAKRVGTPTMFYLLVQDGTYRVPYEMYDKSSNYWAFGTQNGSSPSGAIVNFKNAMGRSIFPVRPFYGDISGWIMLSNFIYEIPQGRTERDTAKPSSTKVSPTKIASGVHGFGIGAINAAEFDAFKNATDKPTVMVAKGLLFKTYLIAFYDKKGVFRTANSTNPKNLMKELDKVSGYGFNGWENNPKMIEKQSRFSDVKPAKVEGKDLASVGCLWFFKKKELPKATVVKEEVTPTEPIPPTIEQPQYPPTEPSSYTTEPITTTTTTTEPTTPTLPIEPITPTTPPVISVPPPTAIPSTPITPVTPQAVRITPTTQPVTTVTPRTVVPITPSTPPAFRPTTPSGPTIITMPQGQSATPTPTFTLFELSVSAPLAGSVPYQPGYATFWYDRNNTLRSAFSPMPFDYNRMGAKIKEQVKLYGFTRTVNMPVSPAQLNLGTVKMFQLYTLRPFGISGYEMWNYYPDRLQGFISEDRYFSPDIDQFNHPTVTAPLINTDVDLYNPVAGVGLGGYWGKPGNPATMQCKSNTRLGGHNYTYKSPYCTYCGKPRPHDEDGLPIEDNTFCLKHVTSYGNHKVTFNKTVNKGKGYTVKTYYKCVYCGNPFEWDSASSTDKPASLGAMQWVGSRQTFATLDSAPFMPTGIGDAEGIGATYRCKICSYETHSRAKMLKHLAKNTHLIKETFSFR